MRILIAGAGIGGLAAAIAMRQLGHEVTVVERAAELTEVGAAVALGPHAMKALDFLGAGATIRALNDPPEESMYLDMISGKLAVRSPVGAEGERLYGTRMYTAHRRDLIDALARQAGGAEIRLSAQVNAISQDDTGVTVTLASGERLRGDILIGADGLRSRVRTELLGESEAIFTGYLAWRTVVPAERYEKTFPNIVRVWTGSGRHAVGYPIRKGRQIYSGFYVPAAEVHREDWQTSGDVADLRASFADACADLRDFLDGVDQAFITAAYYRPPLDSWHSGRVVLLGDAAHPVLSTSGSGAALTIEDAVALHGCFRRHGADFQAAFAEFQARRKPRTSQVLAQSRADLQTYHETSATRRAHRARLNAGLRRLDPTGYIRMSWLHGYSEPAQSERPIADILAQTANPMHRPAARTAFDQWRDMFTPDDNVHGWLSQREAYDRFLARIAPPPAANVTVDPLKIGELAAVKVAPGAAASQGPAVLHLHGGLNVYGSASGAVPLAAGIARAVGGWALIPDFRLAPEHTADEMFADVLAAWREVSASGGPAFVSAESGGAALALRLATTLRDRGEKAPAAIYLLSPFLSPTLAAASIDRNAQTEAWLGKRLLLMLAGAYVQADDPANSRLSPLNGDLAGLPPMRVFAAEGEALADDAATLAVKLHEAGGEVALTLVPDSVHAYANFAALPETTAFFQSIGQDARSRLTVTRAGEGQKRAAP